MLGTEWLTPLTGSRLIRSAADAISRQIAGNRTAALDRMNAGQVQHDSLLRMVRHARDTRFGKDHDFARITSVQDYQARVPIREYEYFWTTYWKDAYPSLGG